MEPSPTNTIKIAFEIQLEATFLFIHSKYHSLVDYLYSLTPVLDILIINLYTFAEADLFNTLKLQ